MQSRRTVLLLRWLPVGLFVGTVALWSLGAAVGVRSDSTVWSVFFTVGMLGLMGALSGRLVIAPLIIPRGSLRNARRDEPDFVELRNVHPNFVAAVNQRYTASVAESPAAN